ncbi:tetratricopeptide repeat protein 7B-like [Bolinopsis microptera]|uniref:tetratricopeptide repeat protein 7B-like n=1 Tax=Bolinopsis microptera TaxID=2820187 RepID=UPI00307A7DC6
MSGKASLRIVELLERARIEGDWTHVSQYAEQLPREYSVLKFVSLGECLLEGQQNGKISYNSLHLAKDYINKALNTKNDREGQYYKEAMLLQAKTCYIQAKFQECLDILDKVDMESLRKDVLTFNASRALADAYVYKGMAMEYLKFVSNSEEDTDIESIVECYETAGDLGLELLNSISRSTLNLTLSGVLEIALLRSFLLQMSHGMVEKGLHRLRRILQTSDMPGSDNLRLTLSLTLGQVLLQGLPDNQWSPLVHRDTVSDTLTKRGRNTPTLKKYETVFCPCNKVEEALLSLLIGQVLLYKEGCVSVHQEDEVVYKQANKQAHTLLNLLVSLLAKYSQHRPLADVIEKFLKYSHDDEHICKQFGLSLISSEQFVRGAAVLQKCHDRNVDVSIALVLTQTYVRHLQRHADAIKICDECMPLAEAPHERSRVYLYRGVAEAALCRSSRLREDQNLYNKRSIESFQKSYSLDPNCSQTWYHLALRLASVGEIKKAFRFAHKVEASPGVVNMVDVSHLLALVLSAQNKLEEALNMVTLTLMNYPDNLNLLITKVMLERQVHGGHSALVTCKEVLLPLLERLSTSASKEMLDQTYLPYSDQWTSGKFQLTQWSDRVSTHTTASFTGSTIGTLPAESLCESIDSAIGCDQSNWGYQAEVWYTIADVFLSENMISDAQKCVDEIKQLFPLSHLVSYMNARIRENEDNQKEAEQQYINAVTLTPLHVPSLVALGRLQIELNKPILAEHYLVEATHLKPDEYEAWHYLGQLHQLQGCHQKAADCFLTALRFESSAPVRPYSVLKWKL